MDARIAIGIMDIATSYQLASMFLEVAGFAPFKYAMQLPHYIGLRMKISSVMTPIMFGPVVVGLGIAAGVAASKRTSQVTKSAIVGNLPATSPGSSKFEKLVVLSGLY